MHCLFDKFGIWLSYFAQCISANFPSFMLSHNFPHFLTLFWDAAANLLQNNFMSPTSPPPPPLSILSSGRSRLSRKVKIGSPTKSPLLHLNKLLAPDPNRRNSLANSTKTIASCRSQHWHGDAISSKTCWALSLSFLQAIDCDFLYYLFSHNLNLFLPLQMVYKNLQNQLERSIQCHIKKGKPNKWGQFRQIDM